MLLAETDYADGFEVSLIIGSHPYGNPIAQSVQETASKAGVTFKMSAWPTHSFMPASRHGISTRHCSALRPTSQTQRHGLALRDEPENAIEAKLTQYPAWRSGY